MSKLIARSLIDLKHTVHVITATESVNPDQETFMILRNCSATELLKHYFWADIIIQNNISLRTLWPLFLFRRRVIILHQTWFRSGLQGSRFGAILKTIAASCASNAFISYALAKRWLPSHIVVGNPYDSGIFNIRDCPKVRELVFVGRLVSDKGCSDLIGALDLLKGEGLRPRLTIVGHGPERANLEQLVDASGLTDSIEFVGPKVGTQLARILSAHKILVVPSRWAEPFGIVALEGIACGCAIIGSREGGLSEAIGNCGLVYQNCSATDLARCIKELLINPSLLSDLRASARAHLDKFQPSQFVSQLLSYATEGECVGLHII